MNPGGSIPQQPEGAQVQPNPQTLGVMNQSAQNNASPESGGILPCEVVKSWFSIRIVDEKDAVVEGLTLKLNIPDLGETDRITSKGVDPIRINDLTVGGKGEVKFIECGEGIVFEAVGDIT